MRIPGGNHLATLDFVGVIHGHFRTVGDAVTFPVNTVLVMDHQFTGSRNNDIAAVLALDRANAHPGYGALVLDLDTACGRDSRRRATDVEGAHGQLGTRLTNTLCRHHTNCLTATDEVSASEVTAVARCTDAVTCVAGNSRPYFKVVHVVLFKELHSSLIDHLASAEELRAVTRAHHVFRHGTAENAILQGDHHFTTLDDRFAQNAVGGAAVIFSHHQILADIDQPSCQITRVRSLERRIRKTLTGAMSRNKVFVDVQPLTKIGGDRCLDNGSVGFCHESAHPGKLTNLGVTASSTRVSHHIDGVEGFLLDRFAGSVDDLLHAELVHHFAGYPVTGMGPDIDDFVVAFAIGQQSLAVLFLYGFHFGFCRVQRSGLAIGHDHVIDTDRDSRAGCH